ncbi:DivIVA domain-containing protein [Candidatus Dependentiae bacterium]|nr:DivIVA domain-containing protein [Candidatus Dependentiae bacterium]
MKITPIEIEKIEFKNSMFFGYDKNQVRSFLNEISSDISEIIKENSILKEKVIELQKVQQDYQNMEKKLQDTLMIIQEFKKNVQDSARKDAEQFINETKLQCNIMINEAEKKVGELKKEYNTLMLEKGKIISKLKFMLQEELNVIESFENSNKESI